MNFLYRMYRSVLDSRLDHGNGTLQDNNRDQKSAEKCQDKFERLFGFRLSDLSSVDRFVKLMNRPMDPACLGVMRFVFGTLK